MRRALNGMARDFQTLRRNGGAAPVTIQSMGMS
jgi:hypothetical protein